MPAFARSLAFLAILLCAAAHAEDAVRIHAAASLTDSLQAAARLWQEAGHPAPVLAFGASSALAKQIDAGAPADIYASADRSWMDYLEGNDRLEPGTRVDLLGNALVLVTPADRRLALRMERGFDLAAAFEGRLCTGEPGVVPVGMYAQQALTTMGWWDALRKRIVGGDDVRTALSFVERGECALGIVYATDAAGNARVAVVGRFPPESHAPIVYPFAQVRGAQPEARVFLDWLQHDRGARAAFEDRGFTWLLH